MYKYFAHSKAIKGPLCQQASHLYKSFERIRSRELKLKNFLKFVSFVLAQKKKKLFIVLIVTLQLDDASLSNDCEKQFCLVSSQLSHQTPMQCKFLRRIFFIQIYSSRKWNCIAQNETAAINLYLSLLKLMLLA